MNREWRNICDDSHDQKHLTIMQFNVLSDGLAQNGNFTHCEEKYLEWDFRWPLISDEISTVDPDIFCGKFNALI